MWALVDHWLVPAWVIMTGVKRSVTSLCTARHRVACLLSINCLFGTVNMTLRLNIYVPGTPQLRSGGPPQVRGILIHPGSQALGSLTE